MNDLKTPCGRWTAYQNVIIGKFRINKQTVSSSVYFCKLSLKTDWSEQLVWLISIPIDPESCINGITHDGIICKKQIPIRLVQWTVYIIFGIGRLDCDVNQSHITWSAVAIKLEKSYTIFACKLNIHKNNKGGPSQEHSKS